MTTRFYIKQQGGLTFWRMGRIGGSFYLSRRAASRPVGPGQARHAIWRYAPGAYGPQLRRVHSAADLGGIALGALYSVSMALGAVIAAIATMH